MDKSSITTNERKSANKPSVLIFFDTETTGLPSRDRRIRSDPLTWPRLVELGWILTTIDGKVLEELNFLVKPDGFEIPAAAIEIHGISNDDAEKMGLPITEVINRFYSSARQADLLIAHNLSYDIRIILTELIRINQRDLFSSIQGICTMKSSARFCGIPGRFGKGYKWPSLAGLYKRLHDQEPGSAHRALDDARTCADCYFELKKRGVKMQIEDLTGVFFPNKPL